MSILGFLGEFPPSSSTSMFSLVLSAAALVDVSVHSSSCGGLISMATAAALSPCSVLDWSGGGGG